MAGLGRQLDSEPSAWPLLQATDSFAQEAGNKGVDVLINCAGILGGKEARAQHPLEGAEKNKSVAGLVRGTCIYL